MPVSAYLRASLADLPADILHQLVRRHLARGAEAAVRAVEHGLDLI